MPESPKRTSTKKPTRRSDPRAIARFVEELSWLLSSYSDLDFKALGDLSSDIALSSRGTRNLFAHGSQQPSARFLVGVLPSLFIDEKLFPSNEDIVEFAQYILDISIPRWQKKSKYELIGHVVCQTEQAPISRLESLVDALNRLVDKRGKARISAEKQRQSGASWNEVIQSFLRTR